MFRLSEKYLLILTVTVSGLIALGLVVLGYFHFHEKIEVASQSLATLKAEIEQLYEKQKKMIELEKRINTLRVELNDAREQLPTEEEVPYEVFVDKMVEFSYATKIKIYSVVPVTKTGALVPVAFTPTSYQLDATGGFYELMNFIYYLESYKRFIKVISFKINPSFSVGENKHNLNVLITTYTYKTK
ncbi:MAG: type 4a pilus biogenesis protein PilO [Planctomycetota bacterium]